MPAPTKLGGLSFNYDNAIITSPSCQRSRSNSYNDNKHGAVDATYQSYEISNYNGTGSGGKLQRTNSHKVILDNNNLKNLFARARNLQNNRDEHKIQAENTHDGSHSYERYDGEQVAMTDVNNTFDNQEGLFQEQGRIRGNSVSSNQSRHGSFNSTDKGKEGRLHEEGRIRGNSVSSNQSRHSSFNSSDKGKDWKSTASRIHEQYNHSPIGNRSRSVSFTEEKPSGYADNNPIHNISRSNSGAKYISNNEVGLVSKDVSDVNSAYFTDNEQKRSSLQDTSFRNSRTERKQPQSSYLRNRFMGVNSNNKNDGVYSDYTRPTSFTKDDGIGRGSEVHAWTEKDFLLSKKNSYNEHMDRNPNSIDTTDMQEMTGDDGSVPSGPIDVRKLWKERSNSFSREQKQKQEETENENKSIIIENSSKFSFLSYSEPSYRKSSTSSSRLNNGVMSAAKYERHTKSKTRDSLEYRLEHHTRIENSKNENKTSFYPKSIGSSLLSRDQTKEGVTEASMKNSRAFITTDSSSTKWTISTTGRADSFNQRSEEYKKEFLSLKNNEVKRSVSFNEVLNSRHEYDHPESAIQSAIQPPIHTKSNFRSQVMNNGGDVKKIFANCNSNSNGDDDELIVSGDFNKLSLTDQKEEERGQVKQQQQQQKQQQQQRQQYQQQQAQHQQSFQWDKRNNVNPSLKNIHRKKKMDVESSGYVVKNRNFEVSTQNSFDDGYETGRTSVSSGSEFMSSGSDLFYPTENGMDSHNDFRSHNSQTEKFRQTKPHKPRSLSNLHEILNLEATEERERSVEETNKEIQKKADEIDLNESRKNIHSKLENILKARVKSIKSNPQQKREMRFPDPLLANEPPLIIEPQKQQQQQQQQQQAFSYDQSESFAIDSNSIKSAEDGANLDNRVTDSTGDSVLTFQQQQELFLSTITAKRNIRPIIDDQDDEINQSHHTISNDNQSKMMQESRSPMDASHYGRSPTDASYHGQLSADASSVYSSRRPSVAQLMHGKEAEEVNKKESMLNELRHTMVKRGLSRPASPVLEQSFDSVQTSGIESNHLDALYATVNKPVRSPGQSDMTMPEATQFSGNSLDNRLSSGRANEINTIPSSSEEESNENEIYRNAVTDMLKQKAEIRIVRENESPPEVRPKFNKKNNFSFISNDIESDFPEEIEPLNGESTLQRRLSIESIKPEVDILASASFRRNVHPAKHLSNQSDFSKQTVAKSLEVDSTIESKISDDFYSKVREFKSPKISRAHEPPVPVESKQDLEFSVRERAHTFSENKDSDVKNIDSVKESTDASHLLDYQTRLSEQTPSGVFLPRSRVSSFASTKEIPDDVTAQESDVQNESSSLDTVSFSRRNSILNCNDLDTTTNTENTQSQMESEERLEEPELPVVQQLSPIPIVEEKKKVDASFHPRRRSPFLTRSNRGRNLYQTEYYNPEDNGESVIKPSEFQVHRFNEKKKIHIEVATKPETVEKAKIRVEPSPSLDMKMSLADLKKERNRQREMMMKRFSANDPFLVQMSDGKKIDKEKVTTTQDSDAEHVAAKNSIHSSDAGRASVNANSMRGFDAKKLMGDTLSKNSSRKKIEKWSNETYTNTRVGKINIPDTFQDSRTMMSTDDVIEQENQYYDDLSKQRKHKRDVVSGNSSTTSSPRGSTAKKTRRFSLTSLGSGRMSARSDMTTSTTVPPSPTLSQKSIGSRFKQLFSPRSKRKDKKDHKSGEDELDDDIARRLNMNSSSSISQQFGADLMASYNSASSGAMSYGQADEEDDNFGIDDNFLSTEEWLRQNNSVPVYKNRAPVIKKSLVPASNTRNEPDVNSWKTKKNYIGKVVVPDVFSGPNGTQIYGNPDSDNMKNYNGPIIRNVKKNSGRILYTGEIITNSEAVINSFDVGK